MAIGSDTNGLAGAPAPRFGPGAGALLERDPLRRHLRHVQAAAQCEGVRYSGEAASPVPTRAHRPLVPCTAGTRIFDVNTDGIAHYGMLPDFLQDLRNVGIPRALMTPLFTSADAYILLWEWICRSG